MARNMQQELNNSIKEGMDFGSSNSLFDNYLLKANQNLLDNPNYQQNLFKLKAASNSLSDTTNSVIASISDSQDEMLGATRQARQKAGQTGLGNTGLAAIQGIDSSISDKNLQRQLEQSSKASRETLDTIKLYEGSIAQSLYGQAYKDMVNDRNKGKLGWKEDAGFTDANGNFVEGKDWWAMENEMKDHSGNVGQDPITNKDRDESEKHRPKD